MRASGTPLQTLRATTKFEVATALRVIVTLATVLGALVDHLTIRATGPANARFWAVLNPAVVTTGARFGH